MLLLIENIFLILIMTNHIIFIGDIVGTLARPIDLSHIPESDDEEIRESRDRGVSQRNTTNASPREQVTGRARNKTLWIGWIEYRNYQIDQDLKSDIE